MMFLLHILALVYGLCAIIAGKLRTSRSIWDEAPGKLYEVVEMLYPDSLFKPYETGTTVEQGLIPDLSRTYLIGGGLVAYSLSYLFKRHRG